MNKNVSLNSVTFWLCNINLCAMHSARLPGLLYYLVYWGLSTTTRTCLYHWNCLKSQTLCIKTQTQVTHD